jgi:hypothetical protein
MKTQAFKDVMTYLKSVSMSATTTGKHRGAADFLADRIIQASTQPNLLAFGERLEKLLGTECECLSPDISAGFVRAASGHHALALLLWLRAHPRIAAQMTMLSSRDGIFQKFLDDLDVENLLGVQSGLQEDIAAVAPDWPISIHARCLSPLSHGSDAKGGNATLYRRMDVLGMGGTVMSLPFYAGNALRGQMRDLLADQLVAALGKPQLALWFFHAIYSGGALEEGGAAAKALNKRMGDFGTVRAAGIRELRNMLPALSCLGAALGNKIISGRAMIGDLRPRCREWTGDGDVRADQLMDWNFLTRHDDNEERESSDKHQGMIVYIETLKTGTLLDGGADLSSHASELEESALGMAFNMLVTRGFLGAGNRQGFGKMAFTVTGAPDTAPYKEYLNNIQKVKEYLSDIGAIEVGEYLSDIGAIENAHSESVG